MDIIRSLPGVPITVCIRPSYTWPLSIQQLEMKQARCAEEGFVVTGPAGVQLHALSSGCGPDAAQSAVAASSLLQKCTAHLLADQGTLAPATLESAFQQCHRQLLQLQPQQPQQHTTNGSMSPTNLSQSGASALLVALDPAHQRVLVASAGLCRAVLARSTPAGDLTVMELTPYLALGHDAAETARLDAAGSSICYVAAGAAAAVHRDYQGPASPASNGSSFHTLCQPEAVLVDPEGQVLPGVKASRMLGYASAAAAGVLSTPVVTSWRLTGAESFMVLGTPGLWAAMSPAEVADYVAAALSAGVGSANSGVTTTTAAAPPALAGAGAHATTGTAAGATSSTAGISVGDLLTLEAQERLKLKLLDHLFRLCPGPAGASSSGVVPDVSAVVLQLGSIPRSSAVGLDKQKLASELTNISRSCSSNAEALALQAQWSTVNDELHGSSAAMLAAPPAPALPSLLPLLTVAGGSWPAAFWPTSDPIRVPALPPAAAAAAAAPPAPGSKIGAGGTAEEVTKKFSFEDAAEAAGLLRKSSSRSISSGGAVGLGTRSSAFALSSRLSCELDLTHDHGSQGSCGCLTAECNASAIDSPSDQSMILHKVRLAGAGELESLLFASATTSHPDTTVARVMQPWPNSLTSSLSGWRSSDTLVSAANAGAVSSSRSSMVRMYSHMALQQREQQQHHYPPRRSSSVLIAALNMNHRQSADDAADAGNSSCGKNSNLQQSAAVSFPGSLSNPLLYSYSGSVMHNYQQQQQQTELVTVKKARSYQALSALQAAGVRTAASLPATSADQPSPMNPGGLMTSALLSRSAQTRPAALNGSPIQRLPGAAPFMASAFRPAFPAQERATSTLPSRTASDALRASVVAVSLPLSCPLEGLAHDVISPQESEGRVRGGVTRDNRSSSFRASTEAAAAGSQGIAAELQSAAEHSCEGKVRHGVPRGRSFKLSADGAGVAGTEATDVFPVSLHKAVSAFAAAAMQPVSSEDTEGTVSSKGSSAAAAAAATTDGGSVNSSPVWHHAALKVGSRPSSAPRAEACAVTLASTALTTDAEQSPGRPESCVRGGRARAAAMRNVFSSPDLPSLSNSCTAVDAAYEAALLRPFQTAARPSKNDSNNRTAAGGAGGLHSSSPTCADTAGGFQTPSPFASVGSAFSTPIVGGSAAADGAAMHAVGEGSVFVGMGAGPIFSEVSDDAVHGGELGDESLEGQMHNGRRSNSLSTSLSGLLPSLSGSLSPDENHLASSSSSKQRQHLPLRRSASSYTHSSSYAAASLGPRAPDVSSSTRNQSFVSVRPAAGDVSFSSWQQQVGSSGAAEPSYTAGSPQNTGAPAIEVLRMPSGSFTRVRLSASAPAAAAAVPGGFGLAANSVGMGDHGLGISAGLGLVSASSENLYSQPLIHSVSPAAADSTRYTQFSRVSSVGSDRRAASSAGATVGGAAHERAGAGSWSSSRAWGSSSSRRPSIQFGKVQLPQMQSAFAASDAQAIGTSSTSRSRANRDRSSAQGLVPLLTGDMADFSGSELHMMTQPLTSPGTRRQKSQTLPTLKETPSPGSSPQITNSSTSSRTLDLLNSSDLGDPAAQQQQQDLLHQQMADIMQGAPLCEQHLQDSTSQQAGEVCQESSQDRSEHSATGLMEGLDSSGGSLTDLLLEECGQLAAGDADDVVRPSSPGGEAPPGRQSFEFRRHVQADALYGCSPALMGNSAPGTASSRRDR